MVKRFSGFFGNVAKLTTGSAVAQAITILLVPVITRLFSPEAFGVLGVFTSITSIISSVACLRYERTVMLPESDEKAVNLFSLSIIISLLVSILCAFLIIFFRGYIVKLLNASNSKVIIFLVPLMVFVSGSFLILQSWNLRKKNFGTLSFIPIINAMSAQLLKIFLGFLGFVRGEFLIIATIIGHIASNLYMAYKTWRSDGHFIIRATNLGSMLEGMKRYKDFPIYGSWSTLLNVFSQNLPVLIFGFYFSTEAVGLYVLARRVLNSPMRFVGTSIGRVFFQKAAETKNLGHLPYLVEGVLRNLFILGLFPFLVLIVIGGDLFYFVFGKGWYESGVYAQILCIWIFLEFVYTPVSTLFGVLELQKAALFSNIGLVSLRFISLLIGGILGNPRIAVIILSATGAIYSSVLIVWLTSKADVNVYKMISLSTLFNFCLIPLPILLAIHFFEAIIEPHFIYTLVLCLIGIMLYYILIIKRNDFLKAQLSSILDTLPLKNVINMIKRIKYRWNMI